MSPMKMCTQEQDMGAHVLIQNIIADELCRVSVKLCGTRGGQSLNT